MIDSEVLPPALPRLILASTSVHRRALLDRLGLPYQCRAPGVEESMQPGEEPAARALRLARAKAGAVALLAPQHLVLGSDQVASMWLDGQVHWLHKPGNREACRRQLLTMASREVQFHTAAVLLGGAAPLEHVDLTVVRFRQFSAAEADSYMDREPAFDCAGGFKCEGLGVTLFESISTSDPSALVGLPLIWVCAALRAAGAQV